MDLADFYHSISLNFLAFQLESLGAHRRTTAAIFSILTSHSGERGLPVGPSFSALLAEAVLSYVDERMLASNIRYTRFNDDFRIFCTSQNDCASSLNRLIQILRPLGLELKAAKTKIQAAEDYLREAEESAGWWLRKLGTHIALEDAYGESLDEDNIKKVDSAKSVLLRNIEGRRGPAWQKLVRSAFRAIPVPLKAGLIPNLASTIFDIWPLSSDIAMSLRSRYLQRSVDSVTLLRNLVNATKASAQGTPGNAVSRHYDFSLIWMLDAISRTSWSCDEFERLFPSILPESAAYRELLLASRLSPPHLGGTGHSGWSRRAVALLGASEDPREVDLRSATLFDRELYGAIKSQVGGAVELGQAIPSKPFENIKQGIRRSRSQWTRKKMLILGMTYPSYSRKYVETVCTGAMLDETWDLVRIHPMPLRYLEPGARFKNWQWIYVDCCPNCDDPRPESYSIRPNSVELGEEIPSTKAEERASMLMKSPHMIDSLQSLKNLQELDGTSLGILKPREIAKVYLQPRSEDERREWKEKERELLSQQTLPFLRPPKALDFPDVAFMVDWVDSDGTLHKMGLKQWGIHELYRKYTGNLDRDAKILDKMKKELDLTQREVFFFMGSFRNRLWQFGLMDVYSAKKCRQVNLFGGLQ